MYSYQMGAITVSCMSYIEYDASFMMLSPLNVLRVSQVLFICVFACVFVCLCCHWNRQLSVC